MESDVRMVPCNTMMGRGMKESGQTIGSMARENGLSRQVRYIKELGDLGREKGLVIFMLSMEVLT